MVVHPGASAPSRRYPTEQFASVIARLSEEDGLQVVYTGLAQEAGLIASIQAMTGGDSVLWRASSSWPS